MLYLFGDAEEENEVLPSNESDLVDPNSDESDESEDDELDDLEDDTDTPKE